MDKIKTAFYWIIDIIFVYLLLYICCKTLLFFLRNGLWILLIVAVGYIAYRRHKSSDLPWWLAKIKDFLLRVKRKGGSKNAG